MQNRNSITAPQAFSDFVSYCEDETEDFSSSHAQLIRQAIGYLQYRDRMIEARDFIDRMLGELDEELLRRLWMRTAPPIALGGSGEPYRKFLTEARDLLTDALKAGRFQQR